MSEMDEMVCIGELLRSSSIYGDNDPELVVERVLILPNSSIVKYTYDGNKFIHVWVCEMGMIFVSDCESPTHVYSFDDDDEYHTLCELLDFIPL